MSGIIPKIGWQGGLKGLEEFADRENERVHEGIVKSIKPHTERVAERAKATAPVQTGRLRGAITSEVSKAGHYGRIRVDVEEAPHAVPVIYGGVRNSANPFIHQARDALQAQLIADLERNIKPGG